MDDEGDVIIHGGLCVQRVASPVAVLVAFEEQMSEAHQVVIFEGDHHFIAQAKRDQLGNQGQTKVRQRYYSACLYCASYLSSDQSNFQYLQHQFPWLTASGLIFFTRIHEIVLQPASELSHCLRLQGLCVLRPPAADVWTPVRAGGQQLLAVLHGAHLPGGGMVRVHFVRC